MQYKIPFNKPFIAGKELHYIAKAVTLGQIAADGFYTASCAELLESRFGIAKVLLTPSCTAALEMAAILCEIGRGDEVILASYNFVSTANAIVRQGGRPVFVDVRPDTLNIDEDLIEAAITPRSKAIFPMHYAGVGCDMDRIMAIADHHGLWVVEDAAQGVHSYYKNRALGSIGHLGTYSFHETKNFICGEGGALCINKPELIERAEIIRDKGTDRKKFFRGEVDKYSWVDVGSSYLPSEICAAFLFAQLENLEPITEERRRIFEAYWDQLKPLEAKGLLRMPRVPAECTTNFHMFYILLPDEETRDQLAAHLRRQGILAVFHYVPLHLSPMGRSFGYKESDFPVTETLSVGLLRLPFYYGLSQDEIGTVLYEITEFLDGPRRGRKSAKR
jgi:dTDP-4-amino-4,6-dideoxygalactose transaminase